MCDKCLKRAIGKEIVNVELSLTRVFAKLDKNPSLKFDPEFIRLTNCMTDLISKWDNISEE
jgi:hypothetical protein